MPPDLTRILPTQSHAKGFFVHYFPGGKDQLAIETPHYVAGKRRQMMPTISALRAIRRTLQEHLRARAENLLASDFRDGCPIAAVTLEVASNRPSVCEACRQGFQTWLEVLVQHLNRADWRSAAQKASPR